MITDFLTSRLKKVRRKIFISIGGFFAVFFLVYTLVTSAANGVIALLAWQSTQCETGDNDSGDVGDINVGNYDKNLVSMAKAVADAVGKSLGIDPKWVFGQMYQETGFNASASTALKDNNLSGIKYTKVYSKYATPGGSVGDNTGGVYAHFKSLSAYATVYGKTLQNMLGGKTPKSVEEFVDTLAEKHYFGSYHGGTFYASASEKAAYIAGIKAGAKMYSSAKTTKSAKIEKTAWHNVIKLPDTLKQEPSFQKVLSKAVDIDKMTTNSDSNIKFIPSKKSSTTANKFTFVENMDGEGDTNGGTRDFRTHGKDSDSAWGDDIKKNYDAGVKHIDKTVKEATAKAQKFANDHLGTKFNTHDSVKVVKKADKASKEADKKAKAADKKVKETEQSDHDDMIQNCDPANDGENTGLTGKWQWPFKGISGSPSYLDGGQFGISGGSVDARGTSFHDGFDWSSGLNGVSSGSKIYAITSGKVYKIAQGGLSGWFIDIKAGDYYITYQEAFTSRSAINVKEGQTIKAGDLIGTLGGTHLHLGISKTEIEKAQSSWNVNDGTWLDPIKIIKQGMSKKDSGSGSSLNLSATEDAARRWIVNRESSGNYSAQNGKFYGAYQLDRSYITGKKYGGDGSFSKKNQDHVATGYMKERYGTWKKAQAFWKANGWW